MTRKNTDSFDLFMQEETQNPFYDDGAHPLSRSKEHDERLVCAADTENEKTSKSMKVKDN